MELSALMDIIKTNIKGIIHISDRITKVVLNSKLVELFILFNLLVAPELPSLYSC